MQPNQDGSKLHCKCVKMPHDYHVIFVIIVMQWASLLRDIRVYDLTIKSVLTARSLYKSLHGGSGGIELLPDTLVER